MPSINLSPMTFETCLSRLVHGGGNLDQASSTSGPLTNTSPSIDTTVARTRAIFCLHLYHISDTQTKTGRATSLIG